MPTVTETQLKLSDAASQMILALRHAEDEPTFRSCINSFISAARSVTFVMQKESSGRPELAEWYRNERDALKANPLMRFFNDRRRHSIHLGVVLPVRTDFPIHDYREQVSEIPGRGQVKQLEFTAKTPVQSGDVINIRNGVAIAWRFDGVGKYLPGHSGNVFRLCEDYFRILKDLVNRWLVRLKKGKFLGQEIELEESLVELRQLATVAQMRLPRSLRPRPKPNGRSLTARG